MQTTDENGPLSASGERSAPAAGQPKVTAVIPAYNMERYVERALLSAVGQTYANLDIIVIDDGSTDATARVVDRIAARHPRVRLVRTGNAGVAAARNLGTQMADSLYVAYLDGDDVWHPLKIERQVAALAAHGHGSEWGGCYALYRMIDPLDRVLDNGEASHERGDFFDEHLLRNPIGNGSNLLVRRDLAIAIGGFSPEYAKAGIGGCEDLEFQLRLLRLSKIEVVREFLIGYRLHPTQMSSDIVTMRLSQIAVIENILAEAGLSASTHAGALVRAYLMAAKGFLLTRDWHRAVNLVRASLMCSRAETARRLSAIAADELVYWSLHLLHRLSPLKRTAGQVRGFAEFDPLEGLGGRPRDTLRHRPSLSKSRNAHVASAER